MCFFEQKSHIFVDVNYNPIGMCVCVCEEELYFGKFKCEIEGMKEGTNSTTKVLLLIAKKKNINTEIFKQTFISLFFVFRLFQLILFSIIQNIGMFF